MKRFSDKLKVLNLLREVFNVVAVISLNRFRRLKPSVIAKVPYFTRLEEVLEHLFALYPDHPLFNPREEKRIAVILFLSDLSLTRSSCSRVLEKFFKVFQGKKVKLYTVGEKCKSKKLEQIYSRENVSGVFGKELNVKSLINLVEKLFEDFKNKELDAVYILYIKPILGKSFQVTPYLKVESKTKEKPKKIEKFYGYKTPANVRIVELGESGDYSVEVLKFLPPRIKRRYRKGLILNFETDEDEIIAVVLKLYIQLYVEFIAFEHYTSLNMIRFRTAKRIEDNLSKKIQEVKKLINKARQDKINRELQDIVFALLAFEEKTFRDIKAQDIILEIGEGIKDNLRDLIIQRVQDKFNIYEVRIVKGLTGFRVIGSNEIYDFSLEHYLEEMERKLAKRWTYFY
ncbi:MAG: hypothetical protein DSY42_01975 [Aquifex sp.]|nr:MAG: hypothetical protein DSY42_01975 [Aquifex sp.]